MDLAKLAFGRIQKLSLLCQAWSPFFPACLQPFNDVRLLFRDFCKIIITMESHLIMTAAKLVATNPDEPDQTTTLELHVKY